MSVAGSIASLDGQSIIWQPTAPQVAALTCPALEVLYGGSKGGGKSDFLVAAPAELLALAHRKFVETGIPQKKCRIIVFRKNLEDIKDIIAKSFKLYPSLDPQMGTDGFHIKDKFWEFTSGATVEFRHLDGPLDHEGYNGNEFVMILFDEVQYISEEAYVFLVAQLRSSDPDYRAKLAVRCTANPGGPYGDWVKRNWHIDECPDGGKVFAETVTLADGRIVETTRAFIRAYLKDNPHVDPDGSYEALLRSKMSAEQVRQFLDGDFDCVSGAFFAHLLQTQHHFQRSRPLPASWEYIFGIDWGSDKPACCLWAAMDPDGRLYIIDELHKPGITGSVFGEEMREKYKYQKWSIDHVWRPEDFFGVIDTQAFDNYGSAATAGAGIMEKGFRIFGAKKNPGDRLVGINQMKERLTLDRKGKPQIIIFEDRCPKLASAYKAIQSKPLDPDDYDPHSPHAHAIDAARFIHMQWIVQSAVNAHPMDLEVARWKRVLDAQRSSSSDDGKFSSGYGS